MAVLLVSAFFWSVLGAIVNQANADQLVNPYMFQDWATLHASIVPGQHTFLLKWPLFLMVRLFGYSSDAYIIVTLLTTLLTVGALAYLAYRVVRKPLQLGVLYLALAAMLLPIPAQPYAGALLPVNMAMIATRNLEYVAYLIVLMLTAQLPRLSFKTWRLWVAITLFAVLAADDKIFLPFSIGGAALLLAVFAVRRHRPLLIFAANWMIVSIGGAVSATALLLALDTWVLHVAGSTTTSPYILVHTVHNLILGVIYGLASVLTNFGANPAFDAVQLKQIPAFAAHHLLSIGGLAFLINMVLVGCIMFATYKLLCHSWYKRGKAKEFQASVAQKLALALTSSSLVALAVFVITDHYYPVDARYTGIVLFAGVITLAWYLRQRRWSEKTLVIAGGIIFVGCVSGSFMGWSNYRADLNATASLTTRNGQIAQAIVQHGVKANMLFGDYWRALPAWQAGGNQFAVLPLGDCTTPRDVLISNSWQPQLHKPFVYLLSVDMSGTGFPGCSLAQIIQKYGKPNASLVISGTFDHPKEQLLFYDHGINSNPNNGKPALPATAVAATIDKLKPPACAGKTILSVVAHQDDDLLFMNPDQQRAAAAGDCLRTVYITAGDAGQNEPYWLGREKGAQEAHALMQGLSTDTWLERIVKLAANEYVIIASPREDPSVSLVFMRLHDGNTNGRGFRQTHFESLERLELGKIPNLSSADGQSAYNKQDLIDALAQLMSYYQPDIIHTQATKNLSRVFPDHSDHMAAGRFAREAYTKYVPQATKPVTISYYVGYPIHARQPNVTGQDYQTKAKAFFRYSQYDDGGCTSFNACANHSVYGQYLKREYTSP